MKRKYRRKYNRRSRKYRNRRTKYGRKSLKRTVRRVVNQMAETKKFLYGIEDFQLYHNLDSIPFIDPWQYILKGNDGKTRIGDRIRNRGISFKIWLSNKLDRPNVTYRVIIGTCPQAINGYTMDGAGISAYIWQQVDAGACGNTTVLKTNKEYGFRIIYDRLVPIQKGISGTASGANKETSRNLRIWIKPKRSGIIQYTDGGNARTRGRWLFFLLCAYDSKGTATTDNIASYAMTMEMFYKDF